MEGLLGGFLRGGLGVGGSWGFFARGLAVEGD